MSWESTLSCKRSIFPAVSSDNPHSCALIRTVKFPPLKTGISSCGSPARSCNTWHRRSRATVSGLPTTGCAPTSLAGSCGASVKWGKGAGLLIWERLVKKFIGTGDADSTKVKEGLELFNIGAAVLNGHLESRDYLVGTKPTLADFSVAVPMVYAAPAGLPLDPYPAIRRWYGRMEKIDSWKKSLP